MRWRWAERSVDTIPLILSAVVGASIVPGAIRGTLTNVPAAVWIACYAVYLVALICVTVLADRMSEWFAKLAFSIAVAAAVICVLTAPGAPWLVIVFVFTALVSAYLLPIAVTGFVVTLNTVVIICAALLQGSSLNQLLLTTIIYLILQLNAVIFVRLFLREVELRTQVQVANVSLRATQEVLEARTRAGERVRISRDLHDVLGHRLTVLALALEAASHTEGEQAQVHVLRAHNATKQLLGDLRTTVQDLRIVETDVRQALERVVEGVEDPMVDLQVNLESVSSPQLGETLVRAVQELTTNAIRHANAARLWITIDQDGDGRIVLAAWDDGDGAGEDPRLGNGLTGLRERVEALGGKIAIDSSAGFRVTATVPG